MSFDINNLYCLQPELYMNNMNQSDNRNATKQKVVDSQISLLLELGVQKKEFKKWWNFTGMFVNTAQ